MKAIITGITGQDGSYLAEHLLSLGYHVVGINRRTSNINTQRLTKSVLTDNKFRIIEGEITDPSSIFEIVNKEKPDEFYNLAAQSHVHTSFEQPAYTFQVNATGPLYCLEAIRKFSTKTRFYQASSSEMFGINCTETPNGKFQDENTPFAPNSPYAVAKVAAFHLTQNYRRAYSIHASNGILYNHESPRRGDNFVTRKVTKYVAKFFLKYLNKKEAEVKQNIALKLKLGNLCASRDWGFAGDYVEAMHLMLQQKAGDDYIVATGKTYTIKELLDIAFGDIGVKDWSDFVISDSSFYRPSEVPYLLGNASKAREKLNWVSRTSFEQLIHKMVQADIKNYNGE